MAIEIDWLLKDRVILLHFEGEITIPLLKQASDDTKILLDECSTPLIHSIIDGTGITKYSRNILQLREASQHLFSHPRYGWLVIYGTKDNLSHFFVNMVTEFFRVKMKMVDTRQDAVDFLKSVDNTLPNELV